MIATMIENLQEAVNNFSDLLGMKKIKYATWNIEIITKHLDVVF